MGIIATSSLRKKLRSALANKDAADAVVDAISSLEAAINGMTAEFDTSKDFTKKTYTKNFSVPKTKIDGE